MAFPNRNVTFLASINHHRRSVQHLWYHASEADINANVLPAESAPPPHLRLSQTELFATQKTAMWPPARLTLRHSLTPSPWNRKAARLARRS